MICRANGAVKIISIGDDVEIRSQVKRLRFNRQISSAKEVLGRNAVCCVL